MRAAAARASTRAQALIIIVPIPAVLPDPFEVFGELLVERSVLGKPEFKIVS